ncbi:MAG TPA: hypothetical protein VLV30_02030, partial [Methanomicrobiales archaeon]|nr:hypothetical protein [Methanomicrobiales archaeon]
MFFFISSPPFCQIKVTSGIVFLCGDRWALPGHEGPGRQPHFLINELITSSLKYAFPDGRKGEITIDITDDESNYHFTYHDN